MLHFVAISLPRALSLSHPPSLPSREPEALDCCVGAAPRALSFSLFSLFSLSSLSLIRTSGDTRYFHVTMRRKGRTVYKSHINARYE
jgi:hypothetical protein